MRIACEIPADSSGPLLLVPGGSFAEQFGQPSDGSAGTSAEDESDGDDADEIFEAGEVPGVARVEPCAVRVGGGGDEQASTQS